MTIPCRDLSDAAVLFHLGFARQSPTFFFHGAVESFDFGVHADDEPVRRSRRASGGEDSLASAETDPGQKNVRRNFAEGNGRGVSAVKDNAVIAKGSRQALLDCVDEPGCTVDKVQLGQRTRMPCPQAYQAMVTAEVPGWAVVDREVGNPSHALGDPGVQMACEVGRQVTGRL